MVHALTNRIRKHRRDLHKRLARRADAATQNSQLLQQQRQMKHIQRDAPADHGSELPAKQDQTTQADSHQGAVADRGPIVQAPTRHCWSVALVGTEADPRACASDCPPTSPDYKHT